MDDQNKVEEPQTPQTEKEITETTEEKSNEPAPTVHSANFDKPKLKDKLLGNKKLLAICASVVLLVFAVGAYALFINKDKSGETANTSEEPATPITATVTYVEGTVDRKDGESFVSLKVDEIVKEGDTIRTSGSTSRATLTLENGSITRLNGDTEVTLTSLRSNEVVIMQQDGQVYSRVSPSSGGSHAIETNTGTYTAQGTAFMTTSGGDEESVEVYESTVLENSTSKSVNQGEKLYLKNTEDTEKEGEVEALDIEAVKKDEFVSWCRSEDEKIEAYKDKLGFLSDITAPKLSISSPTNKSTVTLSASETKGSVTIKGKTDAEATLTIQAKSVSGSKPVEVEVKDDGSFESGKFDGFVGTNNYEVIAKDAAGNKKKQTITVYFKRTSTSTGSGITLSYVGYYDGKYQVSWNLGSDFVEADGFKIVYGTDSGPTYENNEGKVFVENGEETAGLELGASSSGPTTYYVRICRYSGDGCDSYSNQVSITVPKKNS